MQPIVWLLGLLVAACATLPPLKAGGASYSGRFSLVIDGADRHETDSGRFVLTVDGRDVTVDLSTPFGTTVARVQTGADGARVTVPSGSGVRTVWGPDAEALSLKVLGWTLPVAGIGDWIEGRPAAGRPYRLEAADGGATRLEQDGWTIRLEPGPAAGRPHRLEMTRPQQADAPSVRLRIVLDSEASA